MDCGALAERKRITHIITGLGVGGAERMLHSLLTGGLQNHFDNTVISLTDDGHYGALLRETGVKVTCLNMKSWPHLLKAPSALSRALRNAQPDLIQGWMYHGNLASHLARPLCDRSPAVHWNIRTSLDDLSQIRRATRLVANLCKRVSGGIDRIIYNSSRSRAQHCRWGFDDTNAIVIPNGFDMTYWQADPRARQAARYEMQVAPDTTVVGFVGRAAPVKGLPTLLSAFRSVLNHHPSAVMVLVGRDMERLDLSGIPADRIRLMGQRSDVAQLLSGFDLFCLSSLVEGFPNVIGEAMACGLPCIATDVGDSKMIVGDAGWVVEPDDPVAYGVVLDKALSLDSDERVRMGALARERIASHFSLGEIMDTYRDLYEQVGGKV